MKGSSYVYAFVGETRWDGRAFFFSFTEEDGEFLDGRHRDVTSVISCQKGLRIRLVLMRLLL